MQMARWFLSVALASLAGCGAPSVSAVRVGPGASGEDAAAPDVAAAPDAAATPDVATTPDVVAPDGPAMTDAAVTPDAAPDGPALTCVSGVRWTRGNRGSDFMNPGQACIQCHARDNEAPTLSVGGTVFNAPHEEDNCNGFNGPTAGGAAYVEIVDATGRTWRLDINRAGNFFSEDPIPGPFRRTRVYGPGGRYNEMSAAPASGDCNRCHTQAGSNYVDPADPAPGRLVVPN